MQSLGHSTLFISLAGSLCFSVDVKIYCPLSFQKKNVIICVFNSFISFFMQFSSCRRQHFSKKKISTKFPFLIIITLFFSAFGNSFSFCFQCLLSCGAFSHTSSVLMSCLLLLIDLFCCHSYLLLFSLFVCTHMYMFMHACGFTQTLAH